jgi:HlyD family secretion protein
MAITAGQRQLVGFAVVFALGIGCGGAAVYFWPRHANGGRDDRPGGKSSVTRVTARGRLEPEGGVINLAAPGPDILAKIVVQAGDAIVKDQQLAILASRKVRQIEQESAKVQLEEAEDRRQKSITSLKAQQREVDARIDQIKKQMPLDVQIQEAKIQVARRQFGAAEDLLGRMRSAGSYPQQEVEHQQLLRDQAEQEYNGAKLALEKIKDANGTALRAAEAQREVIDADLRRVESELPVAALRKSSELAAERWEQTAVKSPVKGKILKVLGHEGELVGTQPVFQVADTSSMVAVAEVYETDAKVVRDWFQGGKRKVEAEIEIRFPNSGVSRFRGQVIYVADMVTRNNALSLDPRQEMDRRVVEVRIRLDPPYVAEAAGYINMQVDVVILDPATAAQPGARE